MHTLLALGIAILSSNPTSQSTNEFRNQSATALQVGNISGEWILKGKQLVHGSRLPMTFAFDSGLKFRISAEGQLAETIGFDGKTMWQLNGSGMPHKVSHADYELAAMDYYVLSGQWARTNSPLKIRAVANEEATIGFDGSLTTAKLVVDKSTHLPKSLSYWGPSGSQTIQYSEFRPFGGVMVPTKAVRDSGANHEEIEFESGIHVLRSQTDYGMPEPDATRFAYDTSVDSKVEVKHMFGYLFIHPLIDGKDEGWFFLDTGAEVMVIDPTVAKAHSMTVVGHESVSGVVSSVMADFYQGQEFKVGPATLKKPNYMSLDMTEFSKALGIKLAGICGYDFISRVCLDIDPKLNTIGVIEPSKVALPGFGVWTPFDFEGSVPSLFCEFEGARKGQFSLDTGSSSTVDFFSPTVARYQLLKDRKTVGSRTGGAGGSAASQVGTIEYFTLGTKRFEKPRVVFQSTDKGAFASPYRDGNIGMGFMGKFRMILDYKNSRLSFLEPSN